MRWVQADFPQRDFILKMEMKSEDHQFDALEEIKYVLQSHIREKLFFKSAFFSPSLQSLNKNTNSGEKQMFDPVLKVAEMRV